MNKNQQKPKVKKQYRPRAAISAQRMGHAMYDMFCQHMGAADAKSEAQSDVKEDQGPSSGQQGGAPTSLPSGKGDAKSDKEEDVENGVKLSRNAYAKHDRIYFEPYSGNPACAIILYGALMSAYVALLSYGMSFAWYALFFTYVFSCYARNRWWNDTLIPRLLSWTLKTGYSRETILNHMDLAAFSPYVHPTWKIACADLLCFLHWFLCQVHAFERGDSHVPKQLFVHQWTGLHPVIKNDERPSNQRANKAVKDRVRLHVYDSVDLTSGFVTRIASTDSMVEQVAPRLRNLSVKDRLLQAEPMCSKVTNLMISGKWFPCLAYGSSKMSLALAGNMDCASTTHMVGGHALSWTWSTLICVCAMFVPVFHAVAASAATPLETTYAACTPIYLVTVLLVAPLGEELLKTFLSRVTGFHRLHFSILFGLLEWGWRGFTVDTIGPMILHFLVGFMTTKWAIACHFMFNAAVVTIACKLYVIFQIVVLGHVTSAPGVDPYIALFEKSDYQMRTYLCFHHNLDTGNGASSGFPLPPGVCDEFERRVQFTEQESWIYPKWREWNIAHGHPPPDLPDKQFSRLYGDDYRIVPPASMPVIRTLLIVLGITVFTASRLYAVGFRLGEVPLPEEGEHGAMVKCLPRYDDPLPRPCSSNTLGFSLRFRSPIFPDFSHGPTALHGCKLRFCRNPPKPSLAKLARLAKFVRRFVRDNYSPISSDADVSVETWLESAPYTQARKLELFRVWDACPQVCKKDLQVDGFIKTENYEDYKPARGINSRSDRFKCATGPFFKLIENEVYHQECFDGTNLSEDPNTMGPFIKHIPVHLRPQFIQTYLGSYPGRYYETDYSQFEKHFTPEIMNSIEMILYKHMLKNFPSTYRLIHRTMTGENKCVYRSFILRILGRRMSGEMCTSLGNGFSNLMLFKFAAHLKGGSATGIVEGDDALFYSTVELGTQDFLDLGFDIKILVHDDLLRTCFCGMMMSRSMSLLRNPRKVLLKFGWTFSPFRNGSDSVRAGLLKAKAMALAYECPSCPILSTLARRVLQVTQNATARFSSGHWDATIAQWALQYSNQTMEVLRRGPSDIDRQDFAEIFGITIPVQLEIERRVQEWDGAPLYDPLVESLFWNNPQCEFWDRFVGETESYAMGSVGGL